jgi:hypothetical protein
MVQIEPKPGFSSIQNTNQMEKDFQRTGESHSREQRSQRLADINLKSSWIMQGLIHVSSENKEVEYSDPTIFWKIWDSFLMVFSSILQLEHLMDELLQLFLSEPEIPAKIVFSPQFVDGEPSIVKIDRDELSFRTFHCLHL